MQANSEGAEMAISAISAISVILPFSPVFSEWGPSDFRPLGLAGIGIEILDPVVFKNYWDS
jgi:hypothetical protein